MTKKTLFAYAIGITVVTTALSGIAFAETNGAWANVSVEAHASTTPPRPILKGVIQTIRKEITDDRARIASTTQEVKNRLEKQRQEMASTTKAMKGELKTERKEIRVDAQAQMKTAKFIMTVRTVWIRINATIVRLDKILTKLDTRITKIKSAGGDTTVAESASADARASLDTAKLDMDAIKTIVSSISSTTPLDSVATSTIKADSQNAEKQLKTVQSDIDKAIQSLQGLLKEYNGDLKANAHASTTSSVETH